MTLDELYAQAAKNWHDAELHALMLALKDAGEEDRAEAVRHVISRGKGPDRVNTGVWDWDGLNYIEGTTGRHILEKGMAFTMYSLYPEAARHADDIMREDVYFRFYTGEAALRAYVETFARCRAMDREKE